MREMLLSLVIFSGSLVGVSEATEPTKSLQWFRRQGADLNSTQSSSAQAAPNQIIAASSSTSDVPSISSGPAFPPSSQPVLLGTGSSSLANINAVSSSLSEQSSSSGIAAPSDLPKENPIASNTSNSSIPSDVLAPSDNAFANSTAVTTSTASETAVAASDIVVSNSSVATSSAADVPAPSVDAVSNSSTTTSAEDSTITPPPFPQLNSTSDGLNGTGIRNGSACGGCVVNAQGLVDWWFPANVYVAVASLSTITLNGTSSFTAVPMSTFTDLNDQLTQEVFQLEESVDDTGSTVDNYVFLTLPAPVAASTSVTTISDINPLPTGTFGIDELNSLNADPSTPSIVVDPAVPTPVTATQVDNVAWYTAYEVEFDQSTTDDSGATVCQKATSTYTLDEPYAYTLDPAITFGDSAVATGPVDEAFLNYIPYASCTVGTWTAAPTMIVVVEVQLQRGFNVFLVHHEVTDPGALDTPTVTTPDGAKDTGASTNVVSAVATINGNTVTFQATVTGNPASVTIPVGGSSVVASVIGGGNGNTGNTGNSGNSGNNGNSNQNNGGGGGVASAIISALGGGSNTNNNGNGNNGNANTGSGVGGAIANVINPSGSGNQNAGSGSVNGVGFVPAGNSNSNSNGNAGSGGVPVITVGGQTFVGNQATEFSLAPGATLTPGGVATIGANTVSLATNAQSIVINGATSQLAPAAAPLPTAISFQGQTITENSQGAFVISGSSLLPGGSAITVGSNTISLNGNGATLTVNNVPITAPATLPTAPVIQIDGTTFQAQGGGQSFIIGGQTLVPGGQIVVAGTTISLASNGVSAFVNGVPQSVAGIIGAPTVNIDGVVYTEQGAGVFVISGTTIRPGQTSVVAGTTFAFGADGSYVVLNGQTSKLSLNSVPVLIIGGTTYAATSGIGYLVGSQTLRPGGPAITQNGHTISLSPNGVTLVVDGLTTVLTPTTTLPPLITFDGTVFTANAGTTYNIHGQILTPGGCIRDGTHSICLAPHATAVTIDGQITKLFPAATLPAKVSAVATTSTKLASPSSSARTATATSTTTKKSAASSMSTNHGLAFVATLLSFISALCAWMS